MAASRAARTTSTRSTSNRAASSTRAARTTTSARTTTRASTAARTDADADADADADTVIVALEPGDSMRTRRAVARTAPVEPASARPSAPLGRVLRVATRPVSVMWPRPTVDEWGRAPGLVDSIAPLAHLRWDISVGGAHLLPATGAALIVINTRRMALTPVSTALALSEALDRPVRFAGRSDTVPFGPFLRRLGGLLAQPDEIRGALRAGEVVIVGAHATSNPRHAGTIDHHLIAPAIRESVPVHIAATLSTPLNRSARVEVAPALRIGRTRRGPLAEVELAETARRRLQDLLDEMGGARSGLPVLNWFREG